MRFEPFSYYKILVIIVVLCETILEIHRQWTRKNCSQRAPQPPAKIIETGKRPPLSMILPDACEKVGGFGDGHTAASGVFPIGREEAFLEALDTLVTTAAG